MVIGVRPETAEKPPEEREFDEPGAWALKPIAILKVLRALTLIASGIVLWGVARASWGESLRDTLVAVAFDEAPLVSAAALRALNFVDARTANGLVGYAAAAFVYAAVLLLQASGLWFGKRWAEHLTSAVTAGLLPFEIVALIHERTPLRVVALLVNVAILAHLGWRLIRRIRHRRRRDTAPPR